ncbi:alpha/beta fold hydrolase [Brevibacillus sp. NRS-1366]|uniref:alpha/beta fold hydrolase n=1 Tax=Brevibacillus sp. NRS-1366 TaxID=3233899 RepID=UPI003D19653C
MENYRTQVVDTGNHQTFFCEGGESNPETIIFLHGSGPGATAQSNWREILPEMMKSFHVIAPDLYGFGQTRHPEVLPKSFWEWTRLRVEQVLELMDHLGIQKARLVGNSMGGYISLNLVMTAPERFERVVLMGSAGGVATPFPEIMRMSRFFKDPSYTALKNLTKWFVYDDKVLGDQLETVLQERYQEIMRPEIRRSYETMFPMMPEEIIVPTSALKRMDLPFLLLHGRDDRFVSMESSLYFLQHLPNVQLHLFDRCGHWLQIEKKETFIKMISDFFRGEI